VCFTNTHFGFITRETGLISWAFILHKPREDLLTVLSGLKTCEIFDGQDNAVAMDIRRKTGNSRMGTLL